MTKRVMKIVVMLLLVVFLVSASSSVFAAKATKVGDSLNLNAFKDGSDTSGAGASIQRIIGAIISIIQIVGTGVAIIMLIVLAIKYISAAPGDKADIKKHAVVYVVGSVVLFAATGILQIIKNFSKNVNAK